MKFIELFKKAKTVEVFKLQCKNYKTYCYLAKINPEKYLIAWENGIFKCWERYFENSHSEGGMVKVRKLKKIYSSDEYRCSEMSDFKPRSYY